MVVPVWPRLLDFLFEALIPPSSSSLGCSMNELLTNEPGNRVQRSVSTPLSGLVDLCMVHKNRHLPRPTLGPRLGPPFHYACPAICWSRCAPRFILFPWVPCACNRRNSNADHLSRSSFLTLISQLLPCGIIYLPWPTSGLCWEHERHSGVASASRYSLHSDLPFQRG
jgi:hypothetical protein